MGVKIFLMFIVAENTRSVNIQKMNSIYYNIDSGQRILGKFYSAEQEASESVTKWHCRLEQLLNRAVNRGEVMQHQIEDMLRHAFWEGLRPDLNDVSGYIYDRHMPFDEFRSELRAIEQTMTIGIKREREERWYWTCDECNTWRGTTAWHGRNTRHVTEFDSRGTAAERWSDAIEQQPYNGGYNSGYNRGGGAYRGSWNKQQPRQ